LSTCYRAQADRPRRPGPGTVFAQSNFFRQGSGDHPQARSFFPDRTAHRRQQHHDYPGRGAFAGAVEIRSFPETVYRESPSLREYRYIERDNRTYVIEPRERTIIEEIN
jgi:hypothetical protein